MPRTDRDRVRAVITTQDNIDLRGHIETAGALTDWLVANDDLGVLTAALLLQIETYLAAHFYALRDQQYVTKQTGDAVATFQTSIKGEGLKATDWGQQAIALDPTGALAALGSSQSVDIIWLGKPVPAQTDYDDRN